MSRASANTREALMGDLESLWQCLDELFDSFERRDWSRRHGKDWVFADVPYHLAYFDHEAARWIERGPDVPIAEQQVIRSMSELSDWNAQRFALRPPGQTPEQSLKQMSENRTLIRALIGRSSDTYLERPVFVPLGGIGWTTARTALMACRAHTWGELTQLRIRANRGEPLPRPSATHGALDFYMNFFRLILNYEQAARTPFTVVMEFTGPGGGAWTLRVADGTLSVSEERAATADLEMTQSPETFVKTMNHIHNPMLAMLTGAIKVHGFRKMGTFSRLFPEPKPDQTLGSFFDKLSAAA